MDVEKLNALNKECYGCKDCPLSRNSKSQPYWYHNAQYAVMYEQLHVIDSNTMDKFWVVAQEYGLKPEQFLHIGTVQCKTFVSRKKGKRVNNIPAKTHREQCRGWVRQYLSAFEPKKMLAFGNVVMEELTGQFSGITENNGKVIYPKYGRYVTPTVLCVSPATLKFNENLIRKALETFQEINVER